METGTYGAIYRISTGQSDRLEACTENLANSMTPGFRRIIATQGKFDAFLQQATSAAQNKSSDNMVVDFTPGPCRQTDNPFDMAINGKGFFVVQKDGNEYYTRNGTFSRSPDGTLINSGGLAVAGENGPIKIPLNTDVSKLTIDSTRTLHAGAQALGRVRVVTFDNANTLTRVGPTLFAAPTGTPALQDTKSTVSNRAVEGSNVSIFEEMSEMISCTRAQESCQKMIHASDQSESKAIDAYSR